MIPSNNNGDAGRVPGQNNNVSGNTPPIQRVEVHPHVQNAFASLERLNQASQHLSAYLISPDFLAKTQEEQDEEVEPLLQALNQFYNVEMRIPPRNPPREEP